MAVLLPVLSALLGGAAGWVVMKIVNHATPGHPGKDLESTLATVASAFLLAAMAIRFKTPGIPLLVYSILVLTLVAVTVYDIRTQTIPHMVTIPGTATGLIAGSFILPSGIRESMLGLLIGGGALLLATVFEKIRKKEIGGGDWKYAAMIGSFIGPKHVVVALILTGVFGALGAVVLAISGNQTRPRALGPWLSAGAIVSILLG